MENMMKGEKIQNKCISTTKSYPEWTNETHTKLIKTVQGYRKQ